MGELRIVVDWDLPLLHTVETRLSAGPTKEQAAIIEKLNVEVKKGYFSVEENNAIMANFLEFCKKHGLPPDPRPFLKFYKREGNCIKGKERLHFAQYLAKGLNDRLLSAVYKRFHNIVVPWEKTGRYVFFIQVN